MANKFSNRQLMAEMKNDLKNMKRNGIMESIFFDEDHHDDEFGEKKQYGEIKNDNNTIVTPTGINDTLKKIRILVIDGLKNLADSPSSIEYDTLKRILFICDKPIEKKEAETEK